MIIIDPGHSYELDVYDSPTGIGHELLYFMKRQGERYPGNVGVHPGTNMQEPIRAIIDRLKYVNGQFCHPNNVEVINLQRRSIYLLEERAAEIHGIAFPRHIYEIEKLPACKTCGHIYCLGHTERAA